MVVLHRRKFTKDTRSNLCCDIEWVLFRNIGRFSEHLCYVLLHDHDENPV